MSLFVNSGIPLITLLGLDLFVSILGLVLFLVYDLEKSRTGGYTEQLRLWDGGKSSVIRAGKKIPRG